MGCNLVKSSSGPDPSKTEARGAEALHNRNINKKKKAHDVRITQGVKQLK